MFSGWMHMSVVIVQMICIFFVGVPRKTVPRWMEGVFFAFSHEISLGKDPGFLDHSR
jgi:hypothetical protein